MPRAVLFGGLDDPLDLPVGEIFTAALANWVGAALRSHEFSMETALSAFVLLQIQNDV